MNNNELYNATKKILEMYFNEESKHFREGLCDEEKQDKTKFITKCKEHIYYSLIVLHFNGDMQEIQNYLDALWDEENEVEEHKPEPEPDNSAILIKKMDGAGIDTLVKIYRNEFNKKLTNMKCSRIPIDVRRRAIIDSILKELLKGDTAKLCNKILETHFAEKPKKENEANWISEFSVGEEVLVRNREPKIKAVIHKINKKSVSVRKFVYNTIDDIDAIKNQTFGKDRLIWTNVTSTPEVIYSRDRLIKRGENNGIWDKLFLEGEKNVDYGY